MRERVRERETGGEGEVEGGTVFLYVVLFNFVWVSFPSSSTNNKGISLAFFTATGQVGEFVLI